MMPPASPAANMGMAGTWLSDGLSYCLDLSRDVDRRNSAQNERSQISDHDRKLYRHGSRGSQRYPVDISRTGHRTERYRSWLDPWQQGSTDLRPCTRYRQDDTKTKPWLRRGHPHRYPVGRSGPPSLPPPFFPVPGSGSILNNRANES